MDVQIHSVDPNTVEDRGWHAAGAPSAAAVA